MPAAVAFETLPQLFARLADRYRGEGRAALSYRDRKTKAWVDVPWAALEAEVHAFAGFLHARGLRPGDRVAVLSENRPEGVVADFAALALGAVSVPIHAALPAKAVAHVLRDSGARWLVVSTGLQLRKADAARPACPALEGVVSMAEPRKARRPAAAVRWDEAVGAGRAYWAANAAALRRLADGRGPDDLAVLLYPGLQGTPRGVPLTHRNLCASALAALAHLDLRPTDIHLAFLPLAHAVERTVGYTAVLAAGGAVAFAEGPETLNRDLVERRPTVLVGLPALFERAYRVIAGSVEEGSAMKRGLFQWAAAAGEAAAGHRRQGRAPDALVRVQAALADRLVFSALHEKLGGRVRLAVSVGPPLPPAVGRFFEVAGLRFVEAYGRAEAGGLLAASPPDAPRHGTAGHALPGVTLAVRDPATGRLLVQHGDDPAALTTGEGELLAKGPGVAAGYWNAPDPAFADGWFHTGDAGRFEDGHLHLTGRVAGAR